MEGDLSLEQMLVRLGQGLGVLAAHDVLRRQDFDSDPMVVSALDCAVAFERAGLARSAAAVREAVADLKARVHLDPARGDGVIDGVVADALALAAPTPTTETTR